MHITQLIYPPPLLYSPIPPIPSSPPLYFSPPVPKDALKSLLHSYSLHGEGWGVDYDQVTTATVPTATIPTATIPTISTTVSNPLAIPTTTPTTTTTPTPTTTPQVQEIFENAAYMRESIGYSAADLLALFAVFDTDSNGLIDALELLITLALVSRYR
jgi:hypothetical protein